MSAHDKFMAMAVSWKAWVAKAKASDSRKAAFNAGFYAGMEFAAQPTDPESEALRRRPDQEPK